MDIKVGKKIFVIGRYKYGDGETVKITKVGNKYFYISDDVRFFIKTLKHDNGKYSPSIDVWESREAYTAYMERIKLWDNFREDVRNCRNAPDRLSTDGIKQVYKMLFGYVG